MGVRTPALPERIPMIISASRRTDIPAWYAPWFVNRIHEGYVCVRNPMNPHQVSRVSLDPSVVDCIVFWTKDPRPIIPLLDEFDAYPFYFQVTLTGYGRDVEAALPDKRRVLLPAIKELAERVGKDRVIWRYDPILFNEKYTPEYHLHAVREIARELDGCTEKCVISFVDTYRKNESSLRELDTAPLGQTSEQAAEQVSAHAARQTPQSAARPTADPDDELRAFARELALIVGSHGMSCATCAEAIDLADCGIEHNCCIDPALIERIIGRKLHASKDRTQRSACGCVSSIDIGAYNTCANGCRYCYATYSAAAVAKNRAAYDSASPLLCDTLRADDVVVDRKMKSLASDQLTLPL